MYGGGHGVPRNYAEAANWQNYILAHMWLNLAGAHGNAGALANRDHLARMMTPAQIAEAQRLAQERTTTK